eukprot:CAMPEP_0119147254 /NCGR_PEP_ID=MMETSP1310-20130426/40083_1 /TAXON_ID=464262 /ORGANISM="Genus nov. species nov., Strain RCC2339" /LENGTH=56 /DNA_ID=CAMNT_0007139203 /DNA_START=471 /DNA_END=641 /DNA_ORIENTATION=+
MKHPPKGRQTLHHGGYAGDVIILGAYEGKNTLNGVLVNQAEARERLAGLCEAFSHV